MDKRIAVSICPASPSDLPDVTNLMRAYAASLGIDLGFQDFEGELASFPGKYAPPFGALLIGRLADRTPIGCVALRPLADEGCCEMKRLYVTSAGRGLGVGRCLAEAVVAAARDLGYREMRLDTLPSMTSALGLYRSLGFVDMPPYYATPVTGTVFLRLDLSGERP